MVLFSIFYDVDVRKQAYPQAGTLPWENPLLMSQPAMTVNTILALVVATSSAFSHANLILFNVEMLNLPQSRRHRRSSVQQPQPVSKTWKTVYFYCQPMVRCSHARYGTERRKKTHVQLLLLHTRGNAKTGQPCLSRDRTRIPCPASYLMQHNIMDSMYVVRCALANSPVHAT
jgi:hypothetical protein